MGRDKAELELGGKPLWKLQLDKLRALAPETVVVSGKTTGPFREVTVIADLWPQCGPLGGLASIMQHVETAWVVVLAVDLPLVSVEFLQALFAETLADGRGRVPWDGGRWHPLCAVYPRAAGRPARQRVERGELAMQPFVRELEAEGLVRRRLLAEHERALLRNVNTPADLEGLR
jgi:molybdopterin-guanine dinucleotide biosynthesis protein A